jgi:hypothetical protein
VPPTAARVEARVGKKRLELDPPADNVKEPEARYERGDRRLELVTKDGDSHEKFSHETGSLSIDQSGDEEYRDRESADTAERVAKKRDYYLREDKKLQEVFRQNSPTAQLHDRLAPWELISKIILSVSVAYFGVKGLFELGRMAFGASAPEAWSYLGMALVAAIVLAFHWLPLSLARPLARLGYSAVLFYFGITGVIRLYQLLRNPPTRGVNWGYLALSIFSLMVAFAVWRGMRKVWGMRAELYLCRENELHPYFERYPLLQNPPHLRWAIYLSEATLCVGALLLFTSVVSVIYPSSWPLYGYALVMYLAFRATFFPID